MIKSKRITALIIALTTLVALLPNMTIKAKAATLTFEYTFSAKSAHCDCAGTDSNSLYPVFYFYDDKGRKSEISFSGGSITGDGVTKRYETITATSTITTSSGAKQRISYEPWCLSKVGIKCNSKNAWKCYAMYNLKVTAYSGDTAIGTYTFNVEDPQRSSNPTWHYFGDALYASSGKWLDNGNKHTTQLTMGVKFGGNGEQTINPTSLTGWSGFSDNILLDVTSASGTVAKSLTGETSGSRYSSWLNYWNYDESAPDVEFEAKGSSGTGKTVSWDVLKDNSCVTETKTNGHVSGYTIDKAKLISFMNTNAVNKISITTELDFSWWLFSDKQFSDCGTNMGDDIFTRTCTIERKALEVQSVEVKSAVPSEVKTDNNTLTLGSVTTQSDGMFTHFTDNHYLNSSANMVAVTVQFKYSGNGTKYGNGSKDRDEYQNITSSFFSSYTISSVPRLLIYDAGDGKESDDVYLSEGEFIDKNGNTYDETSMLTTQKVGTNGKITFYYKLKDEQLDSLDNGVSLVFENFSIHGYQITQQGIDYSTNNSDSIKAGYLSLLQSAYKVDTVRPYISAEIDTDATNLVNGWTNMAVINYTPSESLNSSMSKGGSKSVNQQMYYAFITSDGKITPITKRDGTGAAPTPVAPAATGMPSTIKAALPSSEYKEAEGALYVYTARDVAGNLPVDTSGGTTKIGNSQYAKIIDLKLDNLAPRLQAEASETEPTESGDVSVVYNFYVEDASKTGQVYYTFSESATPPSTEDVVDGTGEMQTTLDKWAFVNQTDTAVSKYTGDYYETNGSAIMTIGLGEEFNGYIHYYTEDAFGNRSATTTKAINIDNPDIGCSVTVAENLLKPLKDYTITIKATKGSDATDEYDLYYRWTYPNSGGTSYVSSYKEYTSAEETGSGTQYDDNGNAVTMDGECTLQVKVQSGNVIRYYERTLNFDNSAPKVSFVNTNAGAFAKSHTISVSASDDSGIEEATAWIIDSSGSIYTGADDTDTEAETEAAESNAGISLTIGENGTVSDEVVVAAVEAGAYTLRVTAKDYNGYETTSESAIFYIRNEAPDMTVSVASDKTYGLDDYPLLSAEQYSMTLDVSEGFSGSVDGQYLFYRFSDDGQTWSGWQEAGKMTAEDGAHTMSVTLDTPFALINGENLIYVQTGVAASQNSTPNADLAASQSLVVILDQTAPQYVLNLNDMHTNQTINGTLKVTDAFSDEFTIDTSSVPEAYAELLTIEQMTNDDGEPIAGEYNIAVDGNIEASIYAEDIAGNRAEIAVNISGFDFDGPTITGDAPVMTQSGARTDSEVTIYINDASAGKERFALIPADEYDSAFDEDGAIAEEYFIDSDEYSVIATDESFSPILAEVTQEMLANEYEDSNLIYSLKLRGVTGTYYVGIRGEDSLGNETEVILSEPLTPVSEDITMVSGAEISPSVANTKTRLYTSFNMPVYILPQSMITDTAEDDETSVEETNLDLARQNAVGFAETQNFLIESTGTYTLYVVDEIGRAAAFEVTVTDDMVSFGNTNVIEAETVVLRGVEGSGGYLDFTADDADEDPDAHRIITGDELVIPDSNYTIEGYDGKVFFTVVEVTAPDGFYLMPLEEDCSLNYEKGLIFFDNYCEQYLVDPDDTSKGYTTLVYRTFTAERVVDDKDYIIDTLTRETTVLYKTDADTDWMEYDIVTGNIDNTPPVVDGTVIPATVRDPETREPLLFTPGDVTIDMTICDPQSGVDYFYIYGWRDLESEEFFDLDFDLDQIDPSKVLYESDYLTITIEGYYDENGTDLDPYGVKHILITVKENCTIMIGANNKIGGYGYYQSSETGEGDLWIDYINKVELTENEFSVEYYYEDYAGEWQPLTDGIYYQKAKTVVTPTESGEERGLSVYNNGGSGERIYTEYDNQFTYILKDQYGYEYSLPITLESFDNEAGDISYSLATTAKTNQAVPITITAEDAESGVGSVTLQRKTSSETADIPLTDNGDGTYTGSIEKTGSHLITMLDNVGNMAEKSFVVTNIDTVAPEVAGIVWSVEDGQKTSGTVTATLAYTKSGVTITDAEPMSGGSLSANDYVVNKSSSIIRFFDNGTLNVWFTDEYGNVGAEVVTNDRIYSDPPALEAVMTPADDGLSVDISFVKATKEDGSYIDPYRLLTDIMVNYSGTVKFAEEAEYDEDGTIISSTPSVFTFTENGTYTFKVYDVEGLSSNITVEVTGIDKSAPQITQVRWSYEYDVLENGEWVSKEVSDSKDVGDEAGYIIGTDTYHVTNNDVTVTVETDSETTIAGYTDSESSTEHSLDYFENGTYIFNMQKKNRLFDSYAFEVEIIDKTPPVLTLAEPELVFYENTAANTVQYDKSMVLDAGTAFTAYDTFGGVTTDLGERVEIDLGGFNAEDITQNTFDRSSPYTITYTVYDDAHNVTETTMTVRLVGENDSVALVNGSFPDYAGRKELTNQENITITLGNFSGRSYARVMSGVWTMGEMKTRGTILSETSSGSGEYVYTPEGEGWYTFLIQTDKRDYFNLQVYFAE